MAAALLLLGGGVLREADRVPEVERHRVRDLELVASFRRVKARESSRLATLGVVRARGARLRDLVPKLGRRLGGVVARDVDGELYAVGVEAVADEAGHRDAAVLDLGVAQPADGVLVA